MQVLCFFTPILNKFEGMFNVNKLKKKQKTNLRTCLPIGSGLVTVVLKKPSHSNLP